MGTLRPTQGQSPKPSHIFPVAERAGQISLIAPHQTGREGRAYARMGWLVPRKEPLSTGLVPPAGAAGMKGLFSVGHTWHWHLLFGQLLCRAFCVPAHCHRRERCSGPSTLLASPG